MCSRRYQALAAAFAFPAVVALVPGTQALHTVIGALRILKEGASSPASLVAEAAAMGLTTFLEAGAIAVGLAVPLTFDRKLAALDCVVSKDA